MIAISGRRRDGEVLSLVRLSYRGASERVSFLAESKALACARRLPIGTVNDTSNYPRKITHFDLIYSAAFFSL